MPHITVCSSSWHKVGVIELLSSGMGDPPPRALALWQPFSVCQNKGNGCTRVVCQRYAGDDKVD
jgi:hypothetical protein